MTFDVYNKHSEQNIQTFIFFREKVTSLPCYFTIGKSLSKIFLLIKFLLTDFQIFCKIFAARFTTNLLLDIGKKYFASR